MNKVLGCGVVASVVVTAIVVLAQQSEARSLPAFLGQPQNPGDYTCFTNAAGTVRNSCTTTRRFCVALPVDGASHQVAITVTASDINHNIGCFVSATTREGFNAAFTSTLSPSTFGSAAVLTFPTVNVPNAGGLWSCCDIAPTAIVDSFNY